MMFQPGTRCHRDWQRGVRSTLLERQATVCMKIQWQEIYVFQSDVMMRTEEFLYLLISELDHKTQFQNYIHSQSLRGSLCLTCHEDSIRQCLKKPALECTWGRQPSCQELANRPTRQPTNNGETTGTSNTTVDTVTSRTHLGTDKINFPQKKSPFNGF